MKNDNKLNESGLKQRLFWGLAFIESVLTLVWLLSVPSDGKNAVLGRFSASRLLMLTIIGLIAIASLTMLLSAVKNLTLTRKLTGLLKKEKVRRILSYTAFIAFYVLALVLFYFAFIQPLKYQAYYERLRPIGVLGMVLSLETGIFLCWHKDQSPVSIRKRAQALGPVFLTTLGIQIVLYLVIEISGIGITPDPFDWQPNGMAVQWWQVAGSLLAALLITTISDLLRSAIKKPWILTVVLFLLVWGVSAFVWTSVPSDEVLQNSYFMEITPPNDVPYPASDAGYFGLWSESILAGLGFKDQVISRQLFVFMLAGIQAVSGNDIWTAINLLTVLLALIPAMLFLIGKQLHSSGAGLLTAGIAIFRELNTLFMAPHFGVSNSKMFLSDMPMLLMFLIFVSVFISWYKRPQSKMRLIFAGILLGLGGLIRSQVLILLPVAWLFVAFMQTPRLKKTRTILLFTIAVLAVITPALVRSLQLTSSPMLEDSSIHTGEIARRYADDPSWQPEMAAGESTADYELRLNQVILNSIRTHPERIGGFIANHFVKDLIDTWLVLPVGIPVHFTLLDITNSAYQDVVGRMKNTSLLQLFVWATFIALGFAALWKKNGATSLIPPVFCMVYMLSAAIGRYSGWRFILPADWFIYLIFSAGIFELVDWFASHLRVEKLPEGSQAPSVKNNLTIALAVGLIILGWLPVFSDEIIPDQIHLKSEEENLQTVLAGGDFCNASCQSTLDSVKAGQLEILNGRIIYPRWFAAEDGLTSANPWVINQVRDFNRLSFILLNEQNVDVIMPMDLPPKFIPHRAECIVIGNRVEEGWFQATELICPESSGQYEKMNLFAD